MQSSAITKFSVWLTVNSDPARKSEKLRNIVWAGIFNPPPVESDDKAIFTYATGVPVSEVYAKTHANPAGDRDKRAPAQSGAESELAHEISKGAYKRVQLQASHFKRVSSRAAPNCRLAMLINGFLTLGEAKLFATFLCINIKSSFVRAIRALAMCEVFSEMFYKVYIDWATLLNVKQTNYRFLTLENHLCIVKI